MKMVLVRRKGYDIPLTIPEQLLPNKPSLLPHSTFQVSTVTVRDDAMTTSYLPTLPSLQQQQLKSQTLPVGMKPPTSSKHPAQLPLLPPPSRKHFTRTNTGGSVDSPVTSRFNGSDEQGNSPTSDHHVQSRIVGLSHSNWPSALTSDNGKPLKFDSHIEPTVPLSQTPTDAPYCPVDNNMEKSHFVNVASNNNKHKISGSPIVDLGPKPEAVSINEPVDAPVKTKTKVALVPISKDDSGDEEIFDSEDDETSALYAVIKPRGTKGKSSESKTHKHSTLRSSNSFKKHKPKPPPKPEPYSSSKYKKKSSSPSPAPAADTAAVEDSGYVNPSSLDVQEQASSTTAGDHPKVESSIAVDDPAALYAKVMKKKPSMELMEPIVLGQDIAPLATLVEKTVIPSIAIDKDYTEAAASSNSSSSNSSQVTDTSKSMTTASVDPSDATDGLFGSHSAAAQLVSVTRVDNDNINPVTTATTEGSSNDKPIPMPRKKHHRSSSLDLNKMFQKRKSAEQLGKTYNF